jgi:hypothetical protein
LDVDEGIDLLHHLDRRLGLEFSHVVRLVDDLPVQVGDVDRVEVDHADAPHARRREVGQDGRAEPARADDDDPRRLELLLPLHRHLRHDEVTAIAPDLLVGEVHIGERLGDAGDEAHGTAYINAGGGGGKPGGIASSRPGFDSDC